MLKRFLMPVLLGTFVTGCSGTWQVYKRSFDIAMSPAPTVDFSWSQVETAGADLLKIEHGGTSAILALAFIEDGQHQWVSADKGFLEFRQGRLVRTLGFDIDLLDSRLRGKDPLVALDATELQLEYQWGDEQLTRQRTEVRQPMDTQLSIKGIDLNVLQVDEKVSESYWIDGQHHSVSWQNSYWFSVDKKTLVKARIKPRFDRDYMTLSYLSRFQRTSKGSSQ